MAKKSTKRTSSRKPSVAIEQPATVEYQVPLKKVSYPTDRFFNPNSFDNRGNFRPSSGYYNFQTGGVVMSPFTRRRLVGLSEKIFATMGEATAASKLKATWAVAGGFDPEFKGVNQDWATKYALPFLKTWYSTCTNKGLALDFKTLLKLQSRAIDRVGDAAMQFTQTKNGWPKINCVDGTNIGQRLTDDDVISDGKYAGYKVCDGVVLSDAGTPVAYNYLGEDEENDQILSATQMALIMEPDFFGLFRGLPIIFAALQDAYNLQETTFFLSQLVKRHAMLQIVETNREGRAQLASTTSWKALQGHKTDCPTNGSRREVVDPTPLEWTVHGTAYLKALAGEKIEPFLSNLPALETQAFVQGLEKRVLQAIGIPHEVMLSVGSVGGVAARGVGEMVRKVIFERQELLEKYAKLAVVYAINTAMQNGIIPENYDDDFTAWGFTRGPELVLDEGNSRDADRKDYLLGFMSGEDIARKNGQSFSDVSQKLSTEADDLLTRAKELSTKHHEFDLAYCVQLLRQSSPNPIAPVMDTEAQDPGDDGVVKKPS